MSLRPGRAPRFRLAGVVADEAADAEGDRDGDGAKEKLAQARPQDGPPGELPDGHPAGDQGHGGNAQAAASTGQPNR